MNLSRRGFLRTGTRFGLAAMVTGGIGSIAFGQQKNTTPLGTGIGNTIPKAALTDPLFSITRVMFTQNLKTKFMFSQGGVRLTNMNLIEVNDLNAAGAKNAGTSSTDCYLLVFEGPLTLPLKQNTYDIEHAKLGKFRLFIVPGDTTATGAARRYGALINRVF